MKDVEVLEILVDEGLSEVNAVNKDTETPLGILRKRKANGENVEELDQFLTKKEAVEDWR